MASERLKQLLAELDRILEPESVTLTLERTVAEELRQEVRLVVAAEEAEQDTPVVPFKH